MQCGVNVSGTLDSIRIRMDSYFSFFFLVSSYFLLLYVSIGKSNARVISKHLRNKNFPHHMYSASKNPYLSI